MAQRSLVDVIPMSQSLVDEAVRNSVLQFLANNLNKNWVKNATGGFVSKMQQDEYNADDNVKG